MDEVKIQNFANANPGKPLPVVRHLDTKECETLRVALAAKLGQPPQSSALEILRELELRSQDLSGTRPSDSGFRLANLFSQLRLDVRRIYINWSSFDDIDEMTAQDFSDLFHELWYPSSDDIEVFDSSLNWVLLVRHFDVVQIVRTLNGVRP